MVYRTGTYGKQAKERYLQRRKTESWKRIQREKRLLVLSKLGGKCCRCGFDDPRALQIDHVNGDGYKEREGRKHQGHITMLNEILSGNIRHKYQLLCANCNWIKRVENKEYHKIGEV